MILEGADRVEGPWTEYHFRYKPGNTSWAPRCCSHVTPHGHCHHHVTIPRFVLPHQPRLDWQMWFAALGSYNHNPWLLSLVYRFIINHFVVMFMINSDYRLLEGRREVLELLHPDTEWARGGRAPPQLIRAQLYTYTFTGAGGDSRHWWVRERQRTYLPELSLQNKQLEEILR